MSLGKMKNVLKSKAKEKENKRERMVITIKK